MFSRFKHGGFQLPLHAVRGSHHQPFRLLGLIDAEIGQHHIEILSPLSAILYRKLKFHKLYFRAKIQKNDKLAIIVERFL